jgi:hypothetical protein
MISEEYQHIDFWKKPPSEEIKETDWRYIEQNAEGKCLMSMKWIILDFSEKTNNNTDADKNV